MLNSLLWSVLFSHDCSIGGVKWASDADKDLNCLSFVLNVLLSVNPLVGPSINCDNSTLLWNSVRVIANWERCGNVTVRLEVVRLDAVLLSRRDPKHNWARLQPFFGGRWIRNWFYNHSRLTCWALCSGNSCDLLGRSEDLLYSLNLLISFNYFRSYLNSENNRFCCKSSGNSNDFSHIN